LARGKEVGLAVAKDKRGKFPMMIRARQIRWDGRNNQRVQFLLSLNLDYVGLL
jgi:hypothetical protein